MHDVMCCVRFSLSYHCYSFYIIMYCNGHKYMQFIGSVTVLGSRLSVFKSNRKAINMTLLHFDEA